MIRQIRTGQQVPYLHECAAGKQDDHDGAWQVRARGLLLAHTILVDHRIVGRMTVEQLARLCERAAVPPAERLQIRRGAELFESLRDQKLTEDELDHGMAYTLPESSDSDMWALFCALKLASEDAGNDLRTAWQASPVTRQIVQRLMPLCAGQETADDFAPWGRWHRAANVLQGKVNLVANRYFHEVNGTEYQRLPLGDWSFLGIINAMREQ